MDFSTQLTPSYFRTKILDNTFTISDLDDFFKFSESIANKSDAFKEEFEDLALTISILFEDPDKLWGYQFQLVNGNILITPYIEKNQNFSEKVDYYQLISTSEIFLGYFLGIRDPLQTLMDGKIKIQGDIQFAIVFDKIISLFYGFLDM